MDFPIFTGTQGHCHIQGIAVDQKKGYIYYSFTTKLIKSTFSGEIVGSVDGLVGHLGCIDFCEADGRVYGSLEYKNDVIGRGVRKALAIEQELEDAFYAAIFDVDRIDRMHMDAQQDGIMTVVYLQDVYEDYKGTGINQKGETVPHRYGCSGIDGMTIGPMFGEKDGKLYLFTAYGIYSETDRSDNDHQILLGYDLSDLKQYEKPLAQMETHRYGPEKKRKLFIYTGNTEYGIQNLEYDAYTNCYFMAVYPGFKTEFPNYHLFAVDASEAPKTERLKGLAEKGEMLTLAAMGKRHEPTGIRGWHFPHGSTGLYAFGDGTYWISEHHTARTGQCSYIYPYVFDEGKGFVLDL